MSTSSRRVAIAVSLAIASPRISPAQGATSVAAGSYVGTDSLEASHEPATPSRRRGPSAGSASWAIELDTLDLRRKFTIRIQVATPTPVTIVLRGVDSLPLRAGRYLTMIPSSGASHSRPNEIHADVYTMEGERSRHYGTMPQTVTITRVDTSGGRPLVEGTLTMLADRYADAPKGTMVFDYVWLRMSGQFSASAAREIRPNVTVTAAMQERVLRRALDGFLITAMGAANGDGDVDSTRDARRARAFLESRWHESAIIERLTVGSRQFAITLRGRHVPVLCEGSSREEPADCTTLPTNVVQAGRALASRVDGTFFRDSVGSPAARQVNAIHLLPNPVPLKTAFEKLCAEEDSIDVVAERDVVPKLEAIKDSTAYERAATAYIWSRRAAWEKRYRALFQSFAVRHVPIAADGRFSFSDVPAGNYLLFAWVPEDSERIEWYVPVAVQGAPIRRDLARSNVSPGDWYCRTAMPFPAVRPTSR